MPGTSPGMTADSLICRAQRRASLPRLGRPDGRIRFFMENAFGSAVEIIVLPALERPHERGKTREAEAKRDRYQVKIVLHSAASSMAGAGTVSGAGLAASPSLPFRRNALATTRIDEADIA